MDQFLSNIHGDIIAHLVLYKRYKILKKIAIARKTSIGDICLQPRPHLARILALLLCQKGDKVEERAADALRAAEEQFVLYDLVHLEPAMVACEVLKMAAEHTGDDKKLVSPFSSFIYRS